MRIVIDINEDVFTRLFDNGIQDNEIAVDDVCEMARALRLGTPLPKGHGRLIDADKLLENASQVYDEVRHIWSPDFVVNTEYIYSAPTILEAEGSDSE